MAEKVKFSLEDYVSQLPETKVKKKSKYYPYSRKPTSENALKLLRSNMINNAERQREHPNKPKTPRKMEISIEYLEKLWEEQDGKCAVSNIDLNLLDILISPSPLAPSADRIDNSKDYVEGNIKIVGRMFNTGRGAASEEQFDKCLRKYKNQLRKEILEEGNLLAQYREEQVATDNGFAFHKVFRTDNLGEPT